MAVVAIGRVAWFLKQWAESVSSSIDASIATREAWALASAGVSPYAGGVFLAPPLALLWHPALVDRGGRALDVATSAASAFATAALSVRLQRAWSDRWGRGQNIPATALIAAVAGVGGTHCGTEDLATLAAITGSACGSEITVAIGLALAIYFSPTNALLGVPLMNALVRVHEEQEGHACRRQSKRTAHDVFGAFEPTIAVFISPPLPHRTNACPHDPMGWLRAHGGDVLRLSVRSGCRLDGSHSSDDANGCGGIHWPVLARRALPLDGTHLWRPVRHRRYVAQPEFDLVPENRGLSGDGSHVPYHVSRPATSRRRALVLG